MDVGHEGTAARQLLLHRAVCDLDIEKEQRVLLLRPSIDLLDERRVHAKAIHAVLAWSALRDDGDEVQRRLNRRRRIRLLPLARDVIELGEHRIDRIFTQHTHALRQRIPVKRHDPVAGQHRSGKGRRRRRPFRFHSPPECDSGREGG